MANRVFTAELGTSSMARLIAELKQYRDGIKIKNEMFVKRLASLGIPVIDANISSAKGDSDTMHNTVIKLHSFGDYSQATLTLSGQDVLFFEFGSGITYNNNGGHPLASQFGYGVGTYPGQTHAYDPEGWRYMDSTGVIQHSYGTEATMPMLKASYEIIANIRRIAREVYGI